MDDASLQTQITGIRIPCTQGKAKHEILRKPTPQHPRNDPNNPRGTAVPLMRYLPVVVPRTVRCLRLPTFPSCESGVRRSQAVFRCRLCNLARNSTHGHISTTYNPPLAKSQPKCGSTPHEPCFFRALVTRSSSGDYPGCWVGVGFHCCLTVQLFWLCLGNIQVLLLTMSLASCIVSNL